jgi:hypothetical protein
VEYSTWGERNERLTRDYLLKHPEAMQAYGALTDRLAAGVDRLPQQVGEGKLRVFPTARVGQMLFDQFSEPESLVEFPHQDQAAVGSDAGTLEIDLERGVEG